MLNSLRRHWGAKLFFSYLVIIFVGLAVLTIASQFALPSSFDRHMLRMMASPAMMGGGPGFGMMGGQAAPGPEFRAQLFLDYRAGFNDALLAAAVVALATALVIAWYFSRSVTEPIRDMSGAAERIAAGHYRERVAVRGEDELSQLAGRFNDMAQQLEQVEAMRRRLIADVSHELRTPLTSIQGSIEGLVDGILPATRETYDQIHAEARRLNRLVDDLQELSRVEAHSFEIQRQPVTVESLFRTVLKRMGALASARGIGLEMQVPANLPQVEGDEDRLLQVLTNLTDNALHHTPEGGSVTFSARRADATVHISVRDTGAGIAPEHLQHIFDRFYRIDKSRTRLEGGGSGIGLTIAKAIIEAHAGRIWAESNGPGKGSTFTFALPAIQ